MKGQLFTVSAPSGAGKTSLVKQLIQRVKGLQVSVSHTTRGMRPGEEDARDYHFVSKDDFVKMIDSGDFLEHAPVFDNFYGTSKSSVEQTLEQGIDVLLEIDWQGASQVKQLIPEACAIFILPPSKEALLERLRGRGQDSDEVIARRTQEAVTEMQHYDSADYLVINDQFDIALSELVALVEASRLTILRQKEKHSQLVKNLLG